MSVQNGERLATKQDLADMYQEILPYLGGMPEMLANKFSKGDLYSTDEKMIGQWIDGKPLYQKTFDLSTPISITANNWTDVSVSFSGADRIVLCYGYNSSGVVPLYSNPRSGADGFVIYSYVSLSQISKFTIQYTKSTDSAISIGDANDYSTEEKIVGTWIDGKPLYQKTIEITNITDWTPISLGLSNIDMIRKTGDCYAVLSDGTIMGEHSFYASSNTKSYFTVMLYKTTNNQPNAYITKSASTSFAKVVLTIQYTKTS